MLSANLNQTMETTNLKPEEITIGSNEALTINMQHYPHLLIVGDTRTGKSQLLKQIVNQLINKGNVELYLHECVKVDFAYIEENIKVKRYAKDLTEIKNSLQEILDIITKRRELILSMCRENRCDNITQYNNIQDDKLNHIYLIIDEYSYLIPDKFDSKEDFVLKQDINKKINRILQFGRTFGIYIIINSLVYEGLFSNSLLLANTSNKIITKINNSVHSRRIIDSSDATKLENNEMIFMNPKVNKLKFKL